MIKVYKRCVCEKISFILSVWPLLGSVLGSFLHKHTFTVDNQPFHFFQYYLYWWKRSDSQICLHIKSHLTSRYMYWTIQIWCFRLKFKAKLLNLSLPLYPPVFLISVNHSHIYSVVVILDKLQNKKENTKTITI